MKPSITEGKFLIYTLIAVLFLVGIHAFHPQLSAYYNPKNYLAIHTALEFFAISISFSISLFGWRRFEYTKSAKLLLLSLIFFIVGSVDLLHTLTFNGMPFFLTESSVAKATWFWVIARSIEAIAMGLILLLPEQKLNFDPRKLFLTAAICIISLIGYIVFTFEKSLPVLVIEGEGTTFVKNSIEYFVCTLQIASIVISLIFYNGRKSQEYLYLALAFTILFLSELVFTIYQSVYDIDNFSGHLLKVVGYYFILKGFYTSIENETFSQTYFQKKCFQPCELIREHQGIIFTIKKDGDLFVHQICEGSLLYEIELTPEKVVGKTVNEFMPSKARIIEEHYHRAWDTGNNVTFRIEFQQRSLYFSLKPLFKEDKIDGILGSVIDLTEMEESQSKLHWYALTDESLKSASFS